CGTNMTNDDFPVPPPEAILKQLGPTVHEKVIVEDRTFLIGRPSESDRLLDHPAVHSACDRDEYMPYWADLWPAARMLAKVILHEAWTPGTEALEVGCGLGLPGIVALSRGLKVTFSDYDACALRFAADNARLNGYEDFRLMQLDWRNPPADLRTPVIPGRPKATAWEGRPTFSLAAVLRTAAKVCALFSGGFSMPADFSRRQFLQSGAAGVALADTQLAQANDEAARPGPRSQPPARP